MIERDIAYCVWKRRIAAADRIRYKEQRRRVNYLVQKGKLLNMGCFLGSDQPPKKLWRYLGTVGLKEKLDDNIITTPYQLNTFFATRTVIRPSANYVDSGRNPQNVEFAFAGTFELEVFNAIYQIKSNAIGSDGVPIKFLRIILTHILPYLSQGCGDNHAQTNDRIN
jgi:hypothetical protein